MLLGVPKPIGKNNPGGRQPGAKILPQYLILPEYLKAADDQTALTGNGHLGWRARAYVPKARGFDHLYGPVTGGTPCARLPSILKSKRQERAQQARRT